MEPELVSSKSNGLPKPPLPRTMHNYRLDELFKACDTKERGVIGPDEFRELCNKFGISPSDSDVIFIDLDHDGDGSIDFEDFSYGFRDFLTPGSRRGSLQISPITDPSTDQQLLEMEKRHACARNAWKHFMNNVGPSNIQPFISNNNNKEELYDIVEEIRSDPGKEVPPTLETALTSLMLDVQHLHEEYKTLENSFRKEREVHAAQLVALGEELDQQLAKAEAKAKAEARQEAQRQMDTERKKIATEIESQLADLSSQIRTFQKVEEWLAEEEAKEKRLKVPEDQSKLHEAESENRNLRTALVEAQMKATLLQTQLTQKRNEYLDLFNALHSEKLAASEYKSQVDLMQNHLVVLSEANRVLSDANDCLSTQFPVTSGLTSPSSSLSAQHDPVNFNSCPNSLGIIETLSDYSPSSVKQSSSDPRLPAQAFYETDKDSGRSTLLDEIRAEGDGSPLPSGIWTSSSIFSNSLQQSGQPESRHGCVTYQNGTSMGKIGSSCCTENIVRDESSSSPSSSYNRNLRANSSENTYKSFDRGEDADLYEALSVNPNQLGNNAKSMRENDAGFDSQTDSTFYPHRTFKVILAGDAAVGKTTFIERICHGHFTPNLSSTIGKEFTLASLFFCIQLKVLHDGLYILVWDYVGLLHFLQFFLGVDFRVKTIELDGKCVALQLWDTAGQERFRSLTKSYFRRADGVILMYDVSNERTFANIRNWIHNVEEGAGRKVPIVLSGNKVDLREESCSPQGLCVSHSDGEKLAMQCGAIFVETSPKTGHNVFEALMMLAK
ncbi:Ras and EF-hand domain-containing protein [Orchesella cincta]|uniref:Ras and EF-hand domain-containing protein n=1 Tax=Orchesella cincta TaxID=48709 RepID=A0A1D2N479_ORCCI|nr:Ras and EF-hand domain-containing protein [Orchesella cincta]